MVNYKNDHKVFPLCVNSDSTDHPNKKSVALANATLAISDVNKVLKNAYTVESPPPHGCF